MSILERQLRWYIGLRLVVITSMAVPYYLGRLELSAPTLVWPSAGFFGWLFGATCAATLLYIGMLGWLHRYPEAHAYVQFTGDLLLVSTLLYQFGALSPFSPFYLVIIITAAAMLGQQAGLIVASASYGLFALLQLGFAFGWLHSPAGGGEDGLSARLLYALFTHLLGFYSVALLTSRLTRRALQAEGALQEHREDLADLQVVHRDVVESIPSGICTTDLEGNITALNRAGRRILGLDESDVVGRPVQQSVLFDDEQWQRFRSASDRGGRYRAEIRLQRAGQPLDIGFNISPLTDSEGSQRGYIVTFQDLTRWKKLEEEVRLKDRMAAVGELAAGLAHEIGNPLAAISGSVQMLSQSGERSPSELKLLEILLKESQRLDRTIKGFLRFARPREKSSVHFDIAKLLTENVELLRNSQEISPQHTVTLALDPPKAPLVGDPDQISQIFWNLARNALKAMPTGGTLSIAGSQQAEWYQLTFRDTGRGMSAEERANLFHPFQSFFDTGTGIGMAIVYRIVQEHGGRLSVESSPGQGTAITVELPSLLTAEVVG